MLKRTLRTTTQRTTRAFYGTAAAGGGYDTDAQAYITLVEAADTESLETGVKDAINAFVVGCKTDGIWDAIKASCILAGARTLTGALVPLVGTAPTNNNFVSGDYDRKAGLVGDGATTYLDSNRNNNADPQNDFHLGIYASVKNTEASARAYCGATFSPLNGASQILTGVTSNKLSCRARDQTTTDSSGNLHDAQGYFGISRNNSSTYVVRGSSTNNTISVASLVSGDGNIFVFARKNTIGTPDLYSDSRLSFYSIGESLDLALLDSRVSTLMTAIGAAIP